MSVRQGVGMVNSGLRCWVVTSICVLQACGMMAKVTSH